MSTSERDTVTCPNCGNECGAYGMSVPAQGIHYGGCARCELIGPGMLASEYAQTSWAAFCRRMSAVAAERDAERERLEWVLINTHAGDEIAGIVGEDFDTNCGDWLAWMREQIDGEIAREAGGTTEGFNAKGEGTP